MGECKLIEMKLKNDDNNTTYPEMNCVKQILDVLRVQVEQLEEEISGNEEIIVDKDAQLNKMTQDLCDAKRELESIEKEHSNFITTQYHESLSLQNDLKLLLNHSQDIIPSTSSKKIKTTPSSSPERSKDFKTLSINNKN